MNQAITLVILCFTMAANCSLFKSESSKLFEVGLRDRRGVQDINMVEVYITPGDMVDEEQEDRVWLEMQQEGRCWVRVDGKPTSRGHKRRWRVPILACLDHSFRLGVEGRQGECVEFLYAKEVIKGSSLDLVKASRKFHPSRPTNLRMVSNTTLSWDASACVSSYRVTYSSEETAEQVVTVDTTTTSLELGEDCSEFTVEVAAVSGNRISREAEIVVNTCAELEEEVTLGVQSLLEKEMEACPAPRSLCTPAREPKKLDRHEKMEETPSSQSSNTSQSTTPTTPPSSTTPIVVGSVTTVAVVAILLAGVLTIYIRRKRKSSRTELR